MTTPVQPQAGADDIRTASTGQAPAPPDPVAVSPAIGPVPFIGVPRSPTEAPIADPVWQGAARAVRRASRWTVHRVMTMREPWTRSSSG
jgi:hypothetical protein